MRTRRALVLARHQSLAFPAARTLGAAGFEVAVGGVGPGRMLRLSRHCRAYIPVASCEEEFAALGDGLVDRVTRLCRERGIGLLAAADVLGALCAAELRPRLPEVLFFPFAAPGTLRLLDDKWSFYGFLRAHGIPAPRTWLIESLDQARELPLPLVIKQLTEIGGRGMATARDAAQRDARLAQAFPFPGLPALAQEFIPGRDVSLSFLADDGRLIAWAVHAYRLDKTGVKCLEYIEDGRALELGRRIAEAAAYTGLANVDMRYDDRDPSRLLVLECNPRFWGTFERTLGLGVDFLRLGLELAAGRRPAPIERTPTGAAPGVLGALRLLAAGKRAVRPTRAYLWHKLSDPAPDLFRLSQQAVLKFAPRFLRSQRWWRSYWHDG